MVHVKAVVHVKACRGSFRDDDFGPRHLPMPSRAAGGPGAGTAFRRRAAAARPDQWAVFVADVAEPPDTAEHGVGCLPARHGPYHAHGRVEAVGASWPRRGHGRPDRPAHTSDGAY